MSTINRPQDFDPFGCRAALVEALAQPELDLMAESDSAEVEDVRVAAFQVALALGRCRLFGVDAGEDDGFLPIQWAYSALDHLDALLREWCDDARQLASRWNEAETFKEADELCVELVEARMEAWAVCVAVDDALEDACVTAEPCVSELSRRLRETMDCVDRFDEALQREPELLSTVTETRLLENWRMSLATPYRDMPPWWLDGTLETAAKEVTEKARAVQPSRSVWQSAWEAARQPREQVSAIRDPSDEQEAPGLIDTLKAKISGFFGGRRTPEYALALGETEAQPPTRPALRWTVRAPLDQAEWKSREDAGKASVLKGQEVTVEFSLRAEPPPGTLEVQITDGPLTLAFAPRCVGRLLDAAGSLVQEAREQDDRLIFPLSGVEPAALAGWTLEIDFARPGLYHLVLRVPLQPPEA